MTFKATPKPESVKQKTHNSSLQPDFKQVNFFYAAALLGVLEGMRVAKGMFGCYFASSWGAQPFMMALTSSSFSKSGI